MTDRELIDAFTAWRHDVDSEPFAHEDAWTGVAAVADLTREAASAAHGGVTP